MRDIPAGLAAHLAGGTTTLATCWVVRRGDGAALGFTDHDRPLSVDGVVCEPDSGFDRSAATVEAGFAVGEEEVAGALASERIVEADLAAGLWDGAAVEVHWVNWATPDERLMLRRATIGEVTRSDGRFRAELRGPAHALDQPVGRLFSRQCDAELGDARCGVVLAGVTMAATISGGTVARLAVSGIDAMAAGWFARGRLLLDGRSLPIAEHWIDGGSVWITPVRPLPAMPADGTAVSLVAGCDKAFATCAEKFANTLNFRGFPHMPGRDFVFSYARGDGGDDGGVLF